MDIKRSLKSQCIIHFVDCQYIYCFHCVAYEMSIDFGNIAAWDNSLNIKLEFFLTLHSSEGANYSKLFIILDSKMSIKNNAFQRMTNYFLNDQLQLNIIVSIRIYI